VPPQVFLAVGGDVLAKYGTLVRRNWPASLGGEGYQEAFTRAGAAWAIGRNGLLAPYATNDPRVEWVTDPVSGLLQPYLLLEAAGTNLIENSDCEADIVGWGVVGASATVTRDNAQAFNGAWSAKFVGNNNATEGVFLTTRAGARFAATAGTTYTQSFRIYAPTAAVGKQMQLRIEWWTATSGGSNISTSTLTVTLVAGWNNYILTATAPATTNAAVPTCYTPSAQGAALTLWFDVPQFEASPFATSVIPTGAGAVTRNVELLTLPWFTQLAQSQNLWFYQRFLERGTVSVSPIRSFAIGNYPTGHVSFLTNGTSYGLNHDETGPTTVTAVPAVTPAYGNVVELLGILFADGSVSARTAVNGGADVVAARTAALAFGTPVATLALANDANGAQPGWQALSRFMVGLGGGTLVNVIADARAVVY
jgi:hypothetical protein